ncbi:hypothetical protein ACFYNL_06125 [Streptomyces sp. NPDC007808]|uniref:hypothetical protein n=1 Tax=Streptomyces sp. NPDC007808 TaxID=3364779 RepID=UPI0036A0EF52
MEEDQSLLDALGRWKHGWRPFLRRTGYALVETRDWLWDLTDQALRKYPSTLSSTLIGQEVSRGGFVRLEPQPALERASRG